MSYNVQWCFAGVSYNVQCVPLSLDPTDAAASCSRVRARGLGARVYAIHAQFWCAPGRYLWQQVGRDVRYAMCGRI